MAILPTNLRSVFASALRRSHAKPSDIIPALKPEDPELAFIASLATLSPAERDAQIKRHAWYLALAERQGIAEVEWQTAHGRRIKTQTIRIR